MSANIVSSDFDRADMEAAVMFSLRFIGQYPGIYSGGGNTRAAAQSSYTRRSLC